MLPALAPPRPPAVIRRLDQLLAVPALRHASVGVLVRSLENGRTVFAHNPDLAAIPASNQKLVTASAALALLGPDFRYRTRVLRRGGDLILQGSGDPTLDFPRLQALADAARAAGAPMPERIVVDDTAFAGPPLGIAWQWDDEPFSFSAQVSGLNIDNNTVRITVTPTTAGQPARATLSSPYGTVTGAVLTVAGDSSAVTFSRARGQNRFVLGGTIGADAKPAEEDVTIEEPARLAGLRFAEALHAPPEIPIAVEAAPADALPVAESTSDPLSVLAGRFLKPSDNLMGECLLRTLGSAPGRPGSVESGVQRIKEWLAARGIPTDGVALVDGSGLSMQDTLTPRFVVALLADRASDRTLRSALPVGGVDGTLRSRFKNTAAAGNVRAKTGTLTVASSLSGYVTTRAGERLAFSILMNHFDRATGSRAARDIQDRLVLALLDLPRRNLR